MLWDENDSSSYGGGSYAGRMRRRVFGKRGGTYYMTGSHMVLAKSSDMDAWEYIANGSAKYFISNLYSGGLPAFSSEMQPSPSWRSAATTTHCGE